MNDDIPTLFGKILACPGVSGVLVEENGPGCFRVGVMVSDFLPIGTRTVFSRCGEDLRGLLEAAEHYARLRSKVPHEGDHT